MERIIKFKRYHFDFDGKLIAITYWGYLDNGFGFTSPAWVTGEDKSKAKDCQFTGLLDKQGKEIYQDDLCIFFIKEPQLVSYKNGAFGYFDGGGSFISFSQNYWFNWTEEGMSNEIEIIGNIFDNPDLIKK